MNHLTSLYPALKHRYQRPSLYLQTAYFLFIITPLFPRKSGRICIILPLLIILAVIYPCFTTGNFSDDYNQFFPLVTLPLAFLDFFVLSPLEGDDVRFLKPPQPGKEATGVSESDCSTAWEKLKWALRLVTNMRGVGWNWQVKGVPEHSNSGLRRFDFVVKYLILAGRSWIYKIMCHYLIGIATAGQFYTNNAIILRVCDVLIGWAGASWAYHGLNSVYRLGAALSVAIRLCEPWEWPPLFGSLSDAWSVRQMWRYGKSMMLLRPETDFD